MTHDLIDAYRVNKQTALLTFAEIRSAVSQVRDIHSDCADLVFSSVEHKVPTKEAIVEAFKAYNRSVPRVALVVSNSPSTNLLFEDEIYLDTVQEPIECRILSDVQIPMTEYEYGLVEKIISEYAPLTSILQSHGYDQACLRVDAWCVGYSSEEDHPRERLAWGLLTYQSKVDDIPYSRPIEGIHIRVSLTSKSVVKFDASEFTHFQIPKSDGARSNYCNSAAECMDTQRMKPITITQPDGPSWHIEEGHVKWMGWDLQVGFSAREGITLNCMSFCGRPLLHKMCIAELVVPYGDPRPPHSWKNAYDAGEDGMGRNANSLKLGCDCLGLIHYMDVYLAEVDGEVRTIKQAICIHEEDAGLAWKHTDWRTGVPESRRNRKLVISSISTIANYEYGTFYYLYPTGEITVDMKLTG